MNEFTSPARPYGTVRHIADSTVRRLSLYLRFLEEFELRGLATVSSEELAQRGGTTSAQVRKDLSFFGSFGKRGLGYDVHELAGRLRQIMGLEREWKIVIIGAGKIGSALVAYRGFRERGYSVAAVYDSSPEKIGFEVDGFTVRDIAQFAADARTEQPDIAVLTIPADNAQEVVDLLVASGIRAVLSFAPAQLQVPPHVALKNMNMAMELESLSFALTNQD